MRSVFTVICLLSFIASAKSADLRVYFGTYTRGSESQGIYTCLLDTSDGKLHSLRLAAETDNPSFVAIHPSKPFLYSVGEYGEYQGGKSGSLSAYRVDESTGKLALLNHKSSYGQGPCHVVVDAEGKHVLAANYNSGSAGVLLINEDGSLGDRTGFTQHTGSSVNKQRQTGPHAHSINLDKANKFAFVADLGIDRVMVYRYDDGSLSPNDPAWANTPPGGGPRHFAIHPSQKYAYVNNEITSSVTAFRLDAEKGQLESFQNISTLSRPHDGNSTAEIQVHPSGKFLYVSNRGHNSIAVFSINGRTGNLARVEIESTRGEVPRNFGIDPSGKFLLAANQNSNDVFVFQIDPDHGTLDYTGYSLSVPRPVCVKFRRSS